MNPTIDWEHKLASTKKKEVRELDRKFFQHARFAVAMADDDEIQEKLRNRGFLFTKYSDYGTHYVKISYNQGTYDHDVIVASFTEPWPFHFWEITPEVVAWHMDDNYWQPRLEELMNDPELKNRDRLRLLSKSEREPTDEKKSPENAFKYIRFIAAVTNRLGMQNVSDTLFPERTRERSLKWQAKYGLKFHTFTENGTHRVQAYWKTIPKPVIDASFQQPWPLCSDNIEIKILWDEREWEQRIKDIISITRREYRERRPKTPNYNLEQRARVYGLRELP